MDNNELLHWGIRGMKWGRRRYQNKDGTWTAQGKARRRDDNGNDDDPNEPIEKKKERILRSKSAETIYKNSHLFTDQEINNAANRLANEKRIKDLIPAKKPGLKQKIAAALKTNVAPPLMDAGKKKLTKMLEDQLGLKDPKDPLKELSDLSKGVSTVKMINDLNKGKPGGIDLTDWINKELSKRGINP